jgi:hypothetical protein
MRVIRIGWLLLLLLLLLLLGQVALQVVPRLAGPC